MHTKQLEGKKQFLKIIMSIALSFFWLILCPTTLQAQGPEEILNSDIQNQESFPDGHSQDSNSSSLPQGKDQLSDNMSNPDSRYSGKIINIEQTESSDNSDSDSDFDIESVRSASSTDNSPPEPDSFTDVKNENTQESQPSDPENRDSLPALSSRTSPQSPDQSGDLSETGTEKEAGKADNTDISGQEEAEDSTSGPLQADGLIPEEGEPVSALYCYTVLPGYKGPLVHVDDDAVWNGMGVGEILGDPEDYEIGTSFSLEQMEYSLPSTYPDISYSLDGREYTLSYDASPEPAPYTYSIEWSKIVVAGGANEGHNHYNPELSWKDSCFHLNGFVHLNIPSRYTVDFAIQQPDQAGFAVDAADSFEVDAGMPLSEITPHPPDQKVVNNQIYDFRGWFDSIECDHLIDPDSIKVEANATYYGRYVAQGADMLTISKDVIHGSEADHTRKWSFAFRLYQSEDLFFDQETDIPYTGKLEIIASPDGPGVLSCDETGVYHIQLSHQQNYVLGLPEGMTLDIQEEDIPENFIAAVSCNDAPLQYQNGIQIQLHHQDALLFCNFKNPQPPTGIHLEGQGWIVLGAGGVVLMTAGKFRRKER